jgi:hypothetical protein
MNNNFSINKYSCIGLLICWRSRVIDCKIMVSIILMLCWPCITVYQYSDWPCITVYQYSDWPCITVYQYIETNVIHFLFSLRIKDLYVFRALLAHPQEVFHKRHLVYCVRGSQLTQHARKISSAVCVTRSED